MDLEDKVFMRPYDPNEQLQKPQEIPSPGQVSDAKGQGLKHAFQRALQRRVARKRTIDDYLTLDIKICKEILKVRGKQLLLFKTWEKKVRKPQFQRIQTKNQPFFIKTLRIYGPDNKLVEAVLTEQVNLRIENKFFYDTSTVFYDDCIYYFKRIYDQEEKVESVESGSIKKRASVSGGASANGDSTEMVSTSYLQLFKYDLVKFRETKIVGYLLVEYNDDDRTFNTIFSQKFGQQ